MNQHISTKTESKQYTLETPAATQSFAHLVAQQLVAGDIIFLEGDLGTGKTFFSQALIQAMGYTGKVLSPTYSLVHSYEIPTDTKKQAAEKDVKLNLHHFDLYRLTNPEELEFIGIRDYLTGQNICLIEWPTKGKGILPSATIHITLDYLHGYTEGRIANIKYHSSNHRYPDIPKRSNS